MEEQFSIEVRKSLYKESLPARPSVVEVEAWKEGGVFHAAAQGERASGYSATWAVRKLADLLGYTKHADVMYVGKYAASVDTFVFQIIEPMEVETSGA